MALTTPQLEGVRNRIGDYLVGQYELTDSRLNALHTEALTATAGSALTLTIIAALEELLGRASLLVSSTGEYGQRQNDDIFRRRQELLREYQEKLATEIKSGVTPSITESFWSRAPGTVTGGVLVLPITQREDV